MGPYSFVWYPGESSESPRNSRPSEAFEVRQSEGRKSRGLGGSLLLTFDLRSLSERWLDR